MESMTVKQVRRLLADAVSGPWELLEDGSVWSYRDGEVYSNICTDVDGDCAPLVAAAPALARMVLEMAEELARLKAAATECLDAYESLAKIEHFTENLYNRLAARMREEHVPTPEDHEQALSRLIQARLDLRATLPQP